MDLPSLPTNASASVAIYELTGCLICHHSILQSIVSDQRTHFTAKEMWQWAHASGIHGSYHVAHHPEAERLMAWWNGLLKSQG